MKKTIKIIAVIITLALLTLSLSSCSITLRTLSEDEIAIYHYNRMYDRLNEALSYTVNTKMKIEQRFDDFTNDFEFRTEVSFSDLNGLKYVEKEYTIEDGSTELQGEFGFSDGKMFLSIDDNKMVSELSAEDFRTFMDESSVEGASFEITPENCSRTSYEKTDDYGYKVAFSNFSGDAIPAIEMQMGSLLGLNKGFLNIKSYSVNAEMDEDHFPIKMTEVIELDADMGNDVIVSTKLTSNTEFLNINGDVKPAIPDLTKYKAISDIRPVMIANRDVKSFNISDSGEFHYCHDIIAKKGTDYYRGGSDLDIIYGETEGNFEYSAIGTLRVNSNTPNQSVEEIYKNGTLKYITVSNGDKKEQNINIPENTARYEFVYAYLYVLMFDISTVTEVSVAPLGDGQKKVTIKADVTEDMVLEMFDFGDDANFKLSAFEYTFIYDAEGELKSASVKGSMVKSNVNYTIENTISFGE